MKTQKKILIVLSNILGNKVFSQRIQEALGGVDGVDKIYLTLKPEDYKRYPAPAPYRFSDTLHMAWVAKMKYLDGFSDNDYKGVFFVTWEPMIGMHQFFKGVRTIVCFDLTPELSFKMVDIDDRINGRTFKRGIRTILKKAIFKPIYNSIFRSADYFLPLGGKWVGDSVVKDYNIDSARIDILPRPTDTEFWSPSHDDRMGQQGKPVILFVGNDFKRKGGLFLLEIFRNYLKPYCSLRIISNDEYLKTVKQESGLEIFRGLNPDNVDVLRELYRSSDIFVFPTIRDAAPNALAEAAAVGLVILTSDHLAGLRDLVIDEENGYLLPYGDREAWVNKIIDLSRDKKRLMQMSMRSRQIACKQLSIDRFNQKIILSIKRLMDA